MAEEQVTSKVDKMNRVAEHTLKLIHQHGLEGLTHSRLARAAGVSRPWLYAYIGKTREALIELAVMHFGRVYAQIDRPPVGHDPRSWVAGQVEGLRYSLHQVKKYPWLMPIYFRYRGTENAIGKCIGEAEKVYVKKQVVEMQNCLGIDVKEARAVAELCTAFKLGLAYRWAVTTVSNDISEEQVILLAKVWLKRASQGIGKVSAK